MKQPRKKPARARKAPDKPQPVGWKTSDDEQIELRRWRGRTEIEAIEALEPEFGLFGTFRVRSASGSGYEVEIRDLAGRRNSCGCIDHRVNGLGTCKHVEGVLARLRRRGVRAFQAAARQGSPRVEIFPAADGAGPAILWPAAASDAARQWLAPFVDADGVIDTGSARLAALLDAARSAPRDVRVSRHLGLSLDRDRRLAARRKAREAFLAEAGAEQAFRDIVKHPLLPYQREGVLHLAFGERALLADEMGLGKTVQAIAACELLARLKGVRRVLVVSPVSVKAEWEEQIGTFTDRASRFVAGPRQQRLDAYREPAFFTLVNYEQVVSDVDDINHILRPDIVVLDEAQRIKNWQTKTARKIKSLRSPYAFVLTGTPLENRIDEVYSIVQYLDPEIFGPLFHFNRDFYELDERGRPVGFRDLEEMHRRLKPVMLRRRKHDVEGELPGRVVKTFFVPMAAEQAQYYEDYRAPALRLAAIAQRRPLTKDEFDRMQQLLACMRMVCDTPAILDPDCRVSPKLEELEGIIAELLEEPGRKIVIFSEWVRMLDMVRELAGEMGLDCAWHTGDVPQLRRRAEVARFRQDPSCRLFLSSDAGAVGLNLQVASAVINIDLPWNPAKLEQRIARVWRKHQTKAVTVVNLVTEGSIEHSILHLLANKQTLADGVLDGTGDLSAIKMPSGRGAMVERMQAMLGQAKAPPLRIVPPQEALADDIEARHGERLLHAEMRGERMLVVLDGDGAALAAERARLAQRDNAAALPVEIIDAGTWETLRRLAELGILGFTGEPGQLLRGTGPQAAATLQAAE